MAKHPRVVLILTRFATDACQRIALLQRLEDGATRVYFLCQGRGLRYPPERARLIKIPVPPVAWVLGRLRASKAAQNSASRAVFQFFLGCLTFVLVVFHRLKGRRVTVHLPLPPWDAAPVGLWIKRIFPKVRLVLDWMDLQTGDPLYEPTRRSSRTERSLLHVADANVYPSEAQCKLQAEALQIAVSSSSVIPHSYSIEGKYALQPQARSKFVLGFLGNISKPPKVDGSAFLELFSRCDQVSAGRVELRLIGDRSLASRPGDPEWLHSLPRMRHERAVSALSDCSAALLLLSDLPYCRVLINGKLPVYLAMGIPVLAVVPARSAVADALRQHGNAVIVDSGSLTIDALSQAIEQVAKMPAVKPLPSVKDVYSWEVNSKVWRRVLFGSDSRHRGTTDTAPFEN